jgi:uncharacterized membrane protein
MGGFVDGILLHQVLQWHHMLTSTDGDNVGIDEVPADTVAGLELNTLWDGLFHTMTWVMVLAGLVVLSARTATQGQSAFRSRALWGWMLVGWGMFNVVEGIVDHHVLAIHHVRAGAHQLWWDLGFLALGAALIAAGFLVHSTASSARRLRRTAEAHRPAVDG